MNLYRIRKTKFSLLTDWQKGLVILTDYELMLLTGYGHKEINEVKRSRRTPDEFKRSLLAAVYRQFPQNLLESRLLEIEDREYYRMPINIRRLIKQELLLFLLELSVKEHVNDESSVL